MSSWRLQGRTSFPSRENHLLGHLSEDTSGLNIRSMEFRKKIGSWDNDVDSAVKM